MNDIGKKGVSEDGYAICISFILDITIEVEAREQLERQAEEQQRQAMRIFGCTPEEFWAKHDWDFASLIVKEDQARVMEAFRQLKKPGDMIHFEYQLVQKDGTPCWVIGSAEAVVDSDGEPVIQSVF